MNFNPSEMIRQLDTALPVSSILAQTRTFLEGCGWKLEIDNEVIEIPKDVELVVRSRAFVKDERDEVFLGDHFEAVVLVGKRLVDETVCARYALLKMYFNLAGQFVSEDRYDQYG